MLGDVFGSNPWFNAHVDGVLPSFVEVVEDRYKSICWALVEHPFRHQAARPLACKSDRPGNMLSESVLKGAHRRVVGKSQPLRA